MRLAPRECDCTNSSVGHIKLIAVEWWLNQNSSAHGGSLVPEETNANSNKEELDLESQEVAIGNQL